MTSASSTASASAASSPPPLRSSPSVPKFILVLLVGLLLVPVSYYFTKGHVKTHIPDHMLGHKVNLVEDLISEEQRVTFMNLLKNISNFPDIMAVPTFYKGKREHIGEAVPYDGKKCPHHFLAPNSDRTLCVVPNRIDVGRHFMLFGGPDALKEKIEAATSRLLVFGHYYFHAEEFPFKSDLFSSDLYLSSSKAICPPDKQYVELFQFHFIIQIPSQSVATHVDGPFFWGADRYHFPQWLIVVMKFSGLFEEEFVDQIQIVTYLHEWYDPSRRGEFIYYTSNDEPPTVVYPNPRFGTVVDGSKTVHAASVYKGKEAAKVVILDKDKPNAIRFVGEGEEERWEVWDGEKNLVNYTTDDLRISLISRARCFANEEESIKFREQQKRGEGMELEEVMDRFKKDLRKRNIPFSDSISPFDWALLLLDTYVTYPRPAGLMPYNYCLISKLIPALTPLMDLVC